jgi:hypothetical protein
MSYRYTVPSHFKVVTLPILLFPVPFCSVCLCTSLVNVDKVANDLMVPSFTNEKISFAPTIY